MAKFLHNGPCHECGSRDNLASYSDGSKWCWGCHHYVPPNISPYVTEVLNDLEKDKISATTRLNDSEQLTKEFTKDLSKETVEWLGKYGIGVGEALQREVYSLPSRQQSIFLLESYLLGHSRSISEAGVYFQARNHHPNSKQRYYTKGSVEDILPIYFYGEGYTKSLVLVEDCLSAIKIARQCDAMPLLGSGISNLKLSRLKPFYGSLITCLDSDMWSKSQEISKRAKMIGFKAASVYREKDPKEYNNSEIGEIIEEGIRLAS